jgi:TRAP-type C4-dicarboxylate transport system substrate-binding protein
VWLLCLALPALALAAAGCAGGTKAGGADRHPTIVLTIANHQNDDSDLKEYIAAVSRLSGGSIKLELRQGWRAQDVDYDRTTVADVRADKVDLAKVDVRSLDELGIDGFQAVSAPFLVDGLSLEDDLLAGGLPGEMLPSVSRLRVEGLAMLPGELERPFGLARRLVKPSDYRDAVIGITPSILSARTFRALGASSRGYRQGELVPYLFDGAALGLAALAGNSYDTEGSSLTANVAFWPDTFLVVANRQVLAKLTPHERTILRKAGSEALTPAIARLRNDDRVETDILCQRGHTSFVTATGPELAFLHAAVRPVYAQLERNAQTRSFIGEIEAMKRQSSPEQAIPCSAPPRPQRTATLLDGIWEMTATFAVAGTDVDTGNYRLILRRGRATLRHVSPPLRWADSSVFSVRGNRVFFRSPGGYGVYRWNLFRDTLTFRYVPGREEGAPNPTFAPWHRVGM